MSLTFADKLASMPGYQPGVPKGKAPEAIADSQIAQLASNESPFPPHPAVVEAIAKTAAASNRYPDPGRDAAAPADLRALRGRLGPDRRRQRLLRDPSRRLPGAV